MMAKQRADCEKLSSSCNPDLASDPDEDYSVILDDRDRHDDGNDDDDGGTGGGSGDAEVERPPLRDPILDIYKDYRGSGGDGGGSGNSNILYYDKVIYFSQPVGICAAQVTLSLSPYRLPLLLLLLLLRRRRYTLPR